MNTNSVIQWEEAGEVRSARWRSERDMPPPKRVILADDRMTADSAFRHASEGTALLWRGDYQNARQLLRAMALRIDRKPRREKNPASSPTEAFHQHRQLQSQRARTLGMLLLPLNADYSIPLRRAPDMRQACEEAYGAATEVSVVSLRELLGLIGAHEWRKKGVQIGLLDARIHPHYGVFSPVRGEYLELVAKAPLPSTELAFDIGAGTGVLAALLAKRGVKRIVATDNEPRALACARDNIERLGLSGRVEVLQADLFPEGRAPLVVCNPPWLPVRPSCTMERTIYDHEGGMLRGFLGGLAAHLTPGGEGWLILSDFAEHLGLRTREELLALIEDAGLQVIERMDVRPTHPKVSDTDDPLHAARSAEVTSLWRLAVRP
jgi:methylase of polypeptide subunit release factors